MPNPNTNLADRSGGLVELFRNFQPRIAFLSLVIAGLLLLLVGGLAYRQLIQEDFHAGRGWRQSTRRVVTPGPRGEIYDRYGRVLVGNQHRLSVVLDLDQLQREINTQRLKIRTAYRDIDPSDPSAKDIPTNDQMISIARVTVVQRYLDKVNSILGRSDQVDRKELNRHFEQQLLAPYVLVDDLTPEEYARAWEQLSADSPAHVAKTAVRDYPYGAAAAHVLGTVNLTSDIDDGAKAENEKDLMTFIKANGTVGKSGLEQKFDKVLQGVSGTEIFRVKSGGFVADRISGTAPRQGQNLTTSLDIALQVEGEREFADRTDGVLKGAFVALDVKTGEVLAMASMPNYNLAEVSPRVSAKLYEELNAKFAWENRATNGFYPPGSTFKLVTSIAGMRAGFITPESTYVTNGRFPIGDHVFRDAEGDPVGLIDYRTAISKSVNTYFINFGLKIGPDLLAAEAHRLHLVDPTGLELYERPLSYIYTDELKRQRIGEGWQRGDTANLSFGQGFIAVTPLEMACFVASLARGETYTRPYLIHDPSRPTQHTEPLGLTPAQYNALIGAMEEVVKTGTASKITRMDRKYLIPGLTIAGKTGTAQKKVEGGGFLEIGWFVCFAPVEDPQIAIAVVVEGEAHEETGGGLYAAPVAYSILKKWWSRAQSTAAP